MQRGLKSPLLFMPKKKIIEKMILLVPLVPYVPLVPHVPLVPGGYMEQGGTSGNKQPPIFTVCLFRAEKPCGIRVLGIPGTSGTSGTSILPKLIFFSFCAAESYSAMNFDGNGTSKAEQVEQRFLFRHVPKNKICGWKPSATVKPS